jgi:hypothetical protein
MLGRSGAVHHLSTRNNKMMRQFSTNLSRGNSSTKNSAKLFSPDIYCDAFESMMQKALFGIGKFVVY